MSTFAQAAAHLVSIANRLDAVLEAGVEDALQELIARLEPVTPKRTGRMQEGYFVDGAAGQWTLQNDMDYARWVIGGTGSQRPNPAINAVLDEAEHDLEAAFAVAVTRLVHDLR